MGDDSTLSGNGIRNIQRPQNVYRVHGSEKKEKKEDRKRREKEFRELLESGVQDSEQFMPGETFDDTVEVESKAMLNHLSAAAPPFLNIVTDDAKAEEKDGGTKK